MRSSTQRATARARKRATRATRDARRSCAWLLFSAAGLASFTPLGCGIGASPGPFLAALEDAAAEACRCEDRACAERVRERVQSAAASAATPTAEERAQASQVLERVSACMRRASVNGGEK